jgi:hypothetical protein
MKRHVVLAMFFVVTGLSCGSTDSGDEKALPLAKRQFHTFSGHVTQCNGLPQEGRTIVATGTYPHKQGRTTVDKPWNDETTTDTNGFYSFKLPRHWSGTVKVVDAEDCPSP